MKVQPSVIAAAIERLIKSAALLDVGSGVRSVIDLCERDFPHSDWAALRAIDYSGDAATLRAWFDRTLTTEPPSASLRGLYFAVCQPVLESGEITADMQVVGTAEYQADDADMEWLFSRHYSPETYAGSTALYQLYGLAYGTHNFDMEVQGVLGNDAEWPVGLAYAVLAARTILEGRTVAELPTDVRRVGIAAGWGEGDLLLIGEVTENGFVPKSANRT